MNRTHSQELFHRASECIPGGVNSPVRSFKYVGSTPVYFQQGGGAYVTDVDGNQYIDFCMGFGPHLFGHSPVMIVDAVKAQIEKGVTFGACQEREVELAELILKGYSFLDKVRLVSSGTEAVMTAIRLARGATSRPKILAFDGCYHGHSDGLLARAGSGVAALAESSSSGVPSSIVSETIVVRLDNPEDIAAGFKKHGSEIAAVLLEPIPANNGLWVPPQETLEAIFHHARAAGSLVIFDEVITGFRLGVSGASGMLGFQPDIVTLGKIIGGGLPLAAIVGKSAVMDHLAPLGSVYQAGTLSGNAVACAAGCAQLKEIFNNPPYEHLAGLTDRFADRLMPILERQGLPLEVASLGSMFWIHFGAEQGSFPPVITSASQKLFGDLFHFLLDQGIYFPPSPYEVCFVSTAHTASILEEVLERLNQWKR